MKRRPYPHLVFDGQDDRITVPDSAIFSQPTTGEITVSSWIRPDVLLFPVAYDGGGGEGTYIHWLQKGNYTTSKHEWTFRMYSNDGTRPNRISFYVFNESGGLGVGSYFQDTVVAGQWIHVVGKIDATNTYIYKNGILRDTDVYNASITPVDTAADVGIGAPAVMIQNPMFFKGAIRDVRFFNRALSNGEVMSLYNGGTITGGLAANFPMNEGAGNVIDSVGALTGTVDGASWNTTPLSRLTA